MKIGAMILAAGAATRMGRAKMLLPLNNTNILEHIILAIEGAGVEPIYIVTGFYHQAIATALSNSTVKLVLNNHWELGMSSSIQIGLNQLLTDMPDVDLVLIVVSDQPFLTCDIVKALIEQYKLTRKPIIASEYGEVKGTPVLFEKAYFKELLNLSGDKGARAILQAYPDAIATVPFKLGELDIDTPADYEQLCSILKNSNVD